MRKIDVLLLLLFSLAANIVAAQTCDPVEDLPPETVVFPPPQNEDNPMGGISDTACINGYYEFAVTIATPETFSGAPLDYISIASTGALDGLPSGISYVCNPPNCQFNAGTAGCILLYGTPDESNDPGAYPLVINGTLSVLGTPLPIMYPGGTGLPDGSYDLHLKPEGDPNCLIISSRDVLQTAVSLSSQPNPTTGYTQIRVNAEVGGDFDFLVSDLLGRVVHHRQVQIFEGENTIEFDGDQLPAGIYTYGLRNEKGAVAQRLVISR